LQGTHGTSRASAARTHRRMPVIAIVQHGRDTWNGLCCRRSRLRTMRRRRSVFGFWMRLAARFLEGIKSRTISRGPLVIAIGMAVVR
jgi:hypothetical protein